MLSEHEIAVNVLGRLLNLATQRDGVRARDLEVGRNQDN